MSTTLANDPVTAKKVELNLRRNRKQDHTAKMDEAAAAFDYGACRDRYWNPPEMSLAWGTPIWDQASEPQRVLLNHLYWVAYYAQIVSAEIATIYFNQTSAAGLYALEGFRAVCDTLDLESAQERAHIAAFRRVSEAVEDEVFGERLFTYPMRGPFTETMIFADSGPFRRRWKALQLRAFGLLSSGNAFVACQYFLVRGLRTLNGKMVQHELSRFAESESASGELRPDAPLPSRISYYHFCDESYHFNSSTVISHDVLRCLPPPTAFERAVINLGVMGCQRDHAPTSSLVAGLFWYDPAGFEALVRVLRSPAFGLDVREARELVRQSFCEENEGITRAHTIHDNARQSYIRYVDGLGFLSRENREMSRMARTNVASTLQRNRRALTSAWGRS